MSFSRVKPASWASGEQLTSAQMNTLDTDHANSVDVSTLSLGSTKSVTRMVWEPPLLDDPTNWTDFGGGASGPGRLATAIGTQSYCYFPIRIPNGAHWTRVTIYIAGVGHIALPATMPQIDLYEQPASTYQDALGGLIDSVVDSSADVGTFNAGHTIVSNPTWTVLNGGNVYFVRFSTGAGANSVAGLKIYGMEIRYTMTALDFD